MAKIKRLPKKETFELDIHKLKFYYQALKIIHHIIHKLEKRMDEDYKVGKKHHYNGKNREINK